MKRLLSILGSIAVAASSASAVVACTDNAGYVQDMMGSKTGIPSDHSQDEADIKTDLLARAKTLILNNEFGLSDAMTKKFMLNEKVSQFNGSDTSGQKMNDIYSNFMNDTSVTTANPKLNMDGTIGDSGGIAVFGEQSLFNAILKKIFPDVPTSGIKKTLYGFLQSLLSAEGFNNTIGEGKLGDALTTALSPILQVIGQLNTPTAMSGIPYALTLIPSSLEKLEPIFKIVGPILNKLQGVQGTVDGLLQDLNNAVVMTDDPMQTVQDNIGDLINEIVTGKDKSGNKVDSAANFNDIVKLIQLGGNYLSMFNDDGFVNDDKTKVEPLDDKTTFAEMNAVNGKTLSSSKYYEINNGKGFNLAAILKGLVYFFGDEDNPNEAKIKKFMQITLLKLDSPDSKPELSVLGKYFVDNFAKLFRDKDGNPLFKGSDGKADNTALYKFFTDALTTNPEQFGYIFNDWSKLKILDDDKSNQAIISYIYDNQDLKRAFLDGNSGTKELTYSLSTLLEIPLQRILMLAKVPGFYSDGEDQKVGDTDLDKTGLLPNYAGYFTQNSITNMAKETKITFRLDDSLTNDNLKYYYFLFGEADSAKTQVDEQARPSTLAKFVDELLFWDPYNSTADKKQSILAELIGWLGGKDSWKNIAIKLGYCEDIDPGDPIKKGTHLDNNTVYANSIMGDIIKMLIPKLGLDSTQEGLDSFNGQKVITLQNVIDNAASDDLTFFAASLSSFAGDILKPTNYDYWLNVLMNDANVFNIVTPDWKKDWDTPNLGFKTTYFKGSDYVQAMSLTISFDFSQLGEGTALINGIPLNFTGSTPSKWTFNISRDNFYSTFSFKNIIKRG